MLDAKEREIQLQFLDEAQDHLQTLESAFLELSNRSIDGAEVNAALRAAHSMKGGGSLMGFEVLSRLSHQLEDSLKVLKVRRKTLVVDGQLEALLLTGVDCLRMVVNCDRQQQPIPPEWLVQQAQPIFDQLRDRLGEPEEESAESVLSPEEGQDIMPILFETEVDGCLNRLEALLATDDHPCLFEEVLILAQELGGLGAMLQLDPFCRLCASVAYAMQTVPDRMVDIAQEAVTEWRRSQSLVLTRQLDLLPTAIQVPGLNIQLDPAIDPMDFLASVSTESSEIGHAGPSDIANSSSFESPLSFDELSDLEDEADLSDWEAADAFETQTLIEQSFAVSPNEPMDDGSLDELEALALDNLLEQPLSNVQSQRLDDSGLDSDRLRHGILMLNDQQLNEALEDLADLDAEARIELDDELDFDDVEPNSVSHNLWSELLDAPSSDEFPQVAKGSDPTTFYPSVASLSSEGRSPTQTQRATQADHQTRSSTATATPLSVSDRFFTDTFADGKQLSEDQTPTDTQISELMSELFADFTDPVPALSEEDITATLKALWEETSSAAPNSSTFVDPSVSTLPDDWAADLNSPLPNPSASPDDDRLVDDPTHLAYSAIVDATVENTESTPQAHPALDDLFAAVPLSPSTVLKVVPSLETDSSIIDGVIPTPAEALPNTSPISSADASRLTSLSSSPPQTQTTLELQRRFVPNDNGETDLPLVPLDKPQPNHLTAIESAAVSSNLGFPLTTAPAAADAPITEFQLLTPRKAESTLLGENEQSGFVRVNVKHLNQLNDLLGELTIDRNGLTLYLKRLRSLVKRLTRQVRSLDKANAHLQSVYDQDVVRMIDGREPLALLSSLSSQSESPAFATNGNVDHHAILRELTLLPAELDRQFDALEMDRYTDLHHLFQTVMEGMVQIQEVAEDLGLNLDDSEQAARNLNKTARQLQIELTHARMRPLADVANRFPRALRELSLQHGKLVEFKLYGGNTLIDRTILDGLGEPLMHIVRNAFDHGLEAPETRRSLGKPETGTINIHASHQGNRTIISISDDGRGIDLQKIRDRAIRMGLDEALLSAAAEEELLSLIFEPGFSTAEKTTDLSGRGVGMDVVRDRLQQLHGDIKITTRAGHGTTFSLSLPLTLSITRVLLAESNGMLIAIPTDAINEMVILEPDQIKMNGDQEVFDYDGQSAGLIRLSQWLAFYCPRTTPDELETPPSIKTPSVLIVKRGAQVTGIEVDRSWREQEVTVRRVAGTISLPEGFSSCTILGDGRVVPLVNVSAILHWILSNQRSTIPAAAIPTHPRLPAAPGQDTASKRRRSRPSVRPQSAPDGSALRQRDQFRSDSPAQSTPSTTAQTTKAGLNAQTNLDQASESSHLLRQQLKVMVVDDSIAVRRLLALTLEKAAYRVEQAKDGQDALEKLMTGQVMDAVICDVEMPRLDGYRLLAKLQADDRLRSLPVMMLTSRSAEKHRKLALGLGAKEYCTKPYNEQILLQKLAEMTDRNQTAGS